MTAGSCQGSTARDLAFGLGSTSAMGGDVQDKYPNIVLVVMDTARVDAFEPFGAPSGSTPVVARMATEGSARAVFAPASWTVPSHAGLFSGLSYREAGFGFPAATHADYRAAGDRIAHRWLPSVLRGYGFSTAGTSANMWISDWGGWDRGFDTWVQVTSGRSLHGDDMSLRQRAAWARQALEARVDDGLSQIEQTYRRWLRDRRPDQPFFWFFNLVECHSPYLPPKPFTPLGPLGRLRAGEDALKYLNFDAIWKGLCSRTDASAAALERMRKLYSAAVTMMDAWLGRLLESLERTGILDETIIVVTSDHGENLGENGLLGHGFWLDDRLIRVPLIVRGAADGLSGPAHSLCDVVGLIAESAGLPDHPWSVSDGDIAVAAFDAPAGSDDPKVAEALQRWGLGDDALRRMTTSFTCATNGRLKLFRRGGREDVVDLESDPLEASPVAVGEEIEASWSAELKIARVALDKAEELERPGVQGLEETRRLADDVEAMEAQMKLLGYL